MSLISRTLQCIHVHSYIHVSIQLEPPGWGMRYMRGREGIGSMRVCVVFMKVTKNLEFIIIISCKIFSNVDLANVP